MQRDRGSRQRCAGQLAFHARVAILAGAVCTATASIRANVVSISNGNGGSWSNPAGWTSGIAPSSGIDTELDFTAADPFGATFTDDIGSGTFILNSLQFDSSATVTELIAGNTPGNSITFATNSASIGPQILQNGSGAFSIANDLALNSTLNIGGAGTGAIGLSGNISGAGGLIIGGAATVNVTGANVYAGPTVINSGVLSVSLLSVEGSGTTGATPSGIGQSNSSAANLVLNGGTLRYVGPAASTDRLFTLGPAGGTLDASGSGAIAFTNTGTIAFRTPNTPVTLTLSGTNTDANTLRASLTDNGTGVTSLLKTGSGTWTLTGPNSFTGNLDILSGTLDLNNAAGSLQSATDVVFTGSGKFVYENNGATTHHGQALDAITFSGGDATVEVDYTAANQNVVIEPDHFGRRAVGATGNIVVNGGINTQTSGVLMTGIAGGFLNVGTFFGGSSYAFVNGDGWLRAINYATDYNAFTTLGGASIPGTPPYVQTTGPILAQGSATFTSLNLAGANNFNLTPSAILTVNGILKSGNDALRATITGGQGIMAASGSEMVIRTDLPNDALTIGTPVLPNGVNALTKSGAGTLTFEAVNSYTGLTTINAGTVTFDGASGSTGGGALVVGGTAGNAVMNIATPGSVTFNGAEIGGITGVMTSPNAAGAINQTSGTFNYSNGGASYLNLGTGTMVPGNAGGYGAYALSNGTLTSNGATSGIRVGAVGLGSYTQTGGNLVLGRELSIGTYGTGVATFTGGSATGSTAYGILVGDVAGNGTLNIGTQASGSATMLSQSSAGVQLANGVGTIGALNLNGGMLQLTAGSLHKGAGSSGVINFNGGALQAGASGLTLIDNTLTAVNIYNGGALIDTQGFTDTISAALLRPAGNGIYPAGGTLNLPGGSGYIGSPLVSVSGGTGAGASAISNLSGGAITGVTFTSPGQNYQPGDVLNFTFAGGGASAPAPALSYTLRVSDLSLNSNGGLSKVGSGTLILSATNTYVGTTNIVNGTLQVDGSLANTAVNVGPGATLAGKGTIGNLGTNAVNVSGVIAPGTSGSNATLTTGPMIWNQDGEYFWKVSQLPTGAPTAGAGANWDSLNISSLAIAATNAHPFKITVVGSPMGMADDQSYSWSIAQAPPARGGTISGFNPSVFVLNVAQFEGGKYPANRFSLSNDPQTGDIVITYAPAPEPSSIALVAFAAIPLAMRRRRRRGPSAA